MKAIALITLAIFGFALCICNCREEYRSAPVQLADVSCTCERRYLMNSGAIIGDGDRKSWDPRAPMIWDNFSIFRTNCAILTSYIHTRVVVSRLNVVTLRDQILRIARFSCRFFTAMTGNKEPGLFYDLRIAVEKPDKRMIMRVGEKPVWQTGNWTEARRVMDGGSDWCGRLQIDWSLSI